MEDLSGASELGGLTAMDLPIDPALFVESGEVFALRVEGDSMVNAGILDGDFVIIRRQNTVEEGEIAAVLIDGEGTLKRWHVRHRDREGSGRDRVDVDDVRDATGDAARGETTGARDRAGPGRAQADLHGIREETDSEEGLGLVAPGGRGPRSPVERPSARCVRLDPANERFEPIYIDEDDCRDVLVFGKYVGLVRGNLRFA